MFTVNEEMYEVQQDSSVPAVAPHLLPRQDLLALESLFWTAVVSSPHQ